MNSEQRRQRIEQIAAEIEAINQLINQRIPALQAERDRLLYEQRVEEYQQQQVTFNDALQSWQREQGYLNLDEYSKKYNLHWREVETGIRKSIIRGHLPPRQFHNGVHDPIGIYYFADEPPTDEQRTLMRQQTMFSKGDAALYLRISEKEFDKKRKATGLEVADRVPTSSGHLANLYRLSDLDNLR